MGRDFNVGEVEQSGGDIDVKSHGFDIVLVIAIILFARLGMRLVAKYIQMKKEQEKESDSKNAMKNKDE